MRYEEHEEWQCHFFFSRKTDSGLKGKETRQESQRRLRLRLLFPADVVERYLDTSPDQQRWVRELVAKRLRLKLQTFNPDRQTRWYRRPPPERWEVAREVLDTR